MVSFPAYSAIFLASRAISSEVSIEKLRYSRNRSLRHFHRSFSDMELTRCRLMEFIRARFAATDSVLLAISLSITRSSESVSLDVSDAEASVSIIKRKSSAAKRIRKRFIIFDFKLVCVADANPQLLYQGESRAVLRQGASLLDGFPCLASDLLFGIFPEWLYLG